MKLRAAHIAVLALIALGLPSMAMAQTCAGNEDFSGPYVFVATRVIPDPMTPMPVEGAPRPNYSNTPMGLLAQGAQSGAAFASTGRVTADGLGSLMADAVDGRRSTALVGRYKVNGDCTLTVTLIDGFRSGLDLLGDPLPGAQVPFQGVLRNRGTELVFVQTGAVKGTVVQLFRPQLSADCTQTTLSGSRGLLATGVQLGTEDVPVMQPLTLMGRLKAENGEFKLDLAGMQSPLQDRQFTGTYQVQPDCTGTGELQFGEEKMKIAFVLVLRSGSPSDALRQGEMHFAVQDAKRIGTGIVR